MEENKKSVDGILERLALVTDATQQLFPNGKSLIVFELDYDDFKTVQSNFRKIDSGNQKFTIDISGVEVVFLLENVIKLEEPKPIEEPKTLTFKEKLKTLFFGKGSESSIKK